jgi:hypothetical protein
VKHIGLDIAADHGGFELKVLLAALKAADCEVDFGAHELFPGAGGCGSRALPDLGGSSRRG